MVASRREWIEIGVVARAHGVNGQVRVRLADPASTILSFVGEVGLVPRPERSAAGAAPAEPTRRLAVREALADAAGYRLSLEGIDDRDAAESLRGHAVLVARHLMPELADGEVYLSDLVGCLVVDTSGREIGAVRDVITPAGQDLLVLDPGGALVPLVDGIVVAIDLDARRLTCDPPEGLLELNAPAPSSSPSPVADDRAGARGARGDRDPPRGGAGGAGSGGEAP